MKEYKKMLKNFVKFERISKKSGFFFNLGIAKFGEMCIIENIL